MNLLELAYNSSAKQYFSQNPKQKQNWKNWEVEKMSKEEIKELAEENAIYEI